MWKKKRSCILIVLLFLNFCLIPIFLFSSPNSNPKYLMDKGLIFDNEINTGIFNRSEVKTWNKTWGGLDYDFGMDIAVDENNNIYIVGTTESFGIGGSDAFLAKYNSSGVQQWNTTWGTTGDDRGYAIALDGVNKIYISGSSGYSLTTYYNFFLAQYNSSGDKQWSKTWGGGESDYIYDLAVNPLGDIYLVGATENYGAKGLDVYLAQYSDSGVQQWYELWGGNNDDLGYGITLNNSRNVYITGETKSYGNGGLDGFIAQYNSSGVQKWNTTYGSNLDECAENIVPNESGDNLYIMGWSEEQGSEIRNAFISQYNNSGVQKWNSTWGGNNYDYGYDIALNNSDIYLIGHTYSYGAGGSDIFIAQYNTSGVHLRDIIWGGPSDDMAKAIVLDNSSKNIYIAGYTMSYGAGGFDALLLRNPKARTDLFNILWLTLLMIREPQNKFLGINYNIWLIGSITSIPLLITISLLIVYLNKKGVFRKVSQETRDNIKNLIKNLGTRFTRLEIADIAEKTKEKEAVITSIINSMIKNKEISATYSKEKNMIIFEEEVKIEEIDELIDSFKEWEKEGKGKKI
jgi:hypothetical protein